MPVALTVRVSVQVFPPIFKAKLAVPIEAGVPVMVYVKLPAPLAKVPAVSVAVSPVTPVEATVWPVCVLPLPPEYGTKLLTPLAAIPCVKVPLLLALAQLRAVILPVIIKVILTSSLAVLHEVTDHRKT